MFNAWFLMGPKISNNEYRKIIVVVLDARGKIKSCIKSVLRKYFYILNVK